MKIEQSFPLFEKGRLIKKDALDWIRDYAPDFTALLFQNYGDGILSGFEISGCQNEICISPGIFKTGASFLCMKNEVRLECRIYGRFLMVVLKKTGGGETPACRKENYELFLEPVRELKEKEYELGRFRLEKGAKLRSVRDYRDFYDLTTEFNTLNLVRVRYAGESGCSLSPCILKMYGIGVLGSDKADSLDLSFAVACLAGPRISADLIRNYLLAKGRTEEAKGENPEWYNALKSLYSSLVSKGEARRRAGGTGKKTIID